MVSFLVGFGIAQFNTEEDFIKLTSKFLSNSQQIFKTPYSYENEQTTFNFSEKIPTNILGKKMISQDMIRNAIKLEANGTKLAFI